MDWLEALDPHPPRARDIFCNRTLNLRAVRAIGYDMDYTLVQYRAEQWERRAYEDIKARLIAQGWPLAEVGFNPEFIARGLVVDTELGNLVKANRFGYVKRATHGTRPLDFDTQRRVYSRLTVDLAKDRWVFLNTLFSLSEGCLYAQLVDLLDLGKLPGVLGYADLFQRIGVCLDAAHTEGRLKAEIVADPGRFVVLDPETPLALLDQRHAGKKLLLITNSEWDYTQAMMSYAFDRYLPTGQTWRSLFDVIIFGARKPDFFRSRVPLFQLVDESGLLRPALGLQSGGIYLGGCASLVEKYLGLSGDEILYVGDHMWGDVRVAKSTLRWRTALVLSELEGEVSALEAFAPRQARLQALMARKEEAERLHCLLRLALQRRAGYGPAVEVSERKVERRLGALRASLEALDQKLVPLAQAAGEVGHRRWGPLMRAGNDKSHLARQIERYADIYTSRVSNFLFRTPFVYLRSPYGSLPHDAPAGPEAE